MDELEIEFFDELFERDITVLFQIDYYNKVEGDSSSWESDWDYYGYEEIEFTVKRIYDSETKNDILYELSENQNKEIEQKIRDHMSEINEEYEP